MDNHNRKSLEKITKEINLRINGWEIEIFSGGLTINCKTEDNFIYLREEDIELLLEAIKEAERQGLWK